MRRFGVMNLQKRSTFFFFIFLLVLFPTDFLLAEEGNSGRFLEERFRLVWLQDYGNGRDALAHGKDLVLYGYDSQDGKGERRLIHRRGSFFLPLFTPDGKSVIFSDRRARKMFLYDWESGHVKELGDGVAVEVWLDTRRRFFIGKPRVWVYCFSGPQREFKNGTRQPLYRFPLDDPDEREMIWNRSIAAWSNLQLSRDGELMGGLFPWPNGGIVRLEDKSWRRFGLGCWTSLSPDNSKLLWIFDGLHRNVQVYDVQSKKNWKVNINSAPGINGFEVYHPRWSNHPRYFTMTGPYEKGEGGNRIGGGGEKVEIYIGRFDRNVKRVEDWLKVTDNSRADFFPELWIENGEKADLEDAITAAAVTEKKSEIKSAWPVVPKRLVFVWDNMKAANQLKEGSPVGFFQCNIDLRGRALHTRAFQLAVTGGWGDTGDAGRKIGQALAESQAATIGFQLTPKPEARGTILLFSGKGNEVLNIKQNKNHLELVSSGTGSKGLQWQDVLTTDNRVHILFTVEQNTVELFVDGKSHGKKKFNSEFATRPIDSFQIGDASGNWDGIIEKIGIYDKRLSDRQIEQQSELAGKNPIQAPLQTLVIEGTLLETTEIPAPDAIGAYSRALVVNTYSVDNVVGGSYEEDRVLVAEWAVLDRQVVLAYGSDKERLRLEKFTDHPELEGERQMMDVFEPDLEMYYRLP
ncbi:MAG: LamG-like jellyroll fold domain-containing protein [Desulfocapsaceae bacterium]|jgi:hypothetical protein|nr:LamG-like jellyroll fold domain-containing protein [Desulfocapsaceae bacterium]